jgi:hypothetical protein
MKTSGRTGYAFRVLAAAALLTGCNTNGGLQSSGLTPSSGANAATSSHGVNPLMRDTGDPSDTFAGVTWMGDVHPDRGKSGFSPDVKRAPRLFFVSDARADAVDAFTMPDLNFKGKITGLKQPQGECSDTHGNIYVANTRGFQVLEYSRSGNYLNTYPDKYGYPVGCAVNPLNGDLAVTNIRGFHHTRGAVLVYASPSSIPTVLTNRRQYYYYFDGYDIHGDLWVDGRTLLKRYILSRCGASSCSTIKLSGGKIYFPGAVQWDKKEYSWVLFDQLCAGKAGACSYSVSASGVLGQATNYENFTGGPVCDLVQGVVAAYGMKYTAGSDYGSVKCVYTGTVSRWKYPAGGTPTNYMTKVLLRPVGAAISTK